MVESLTMRRFVGTLAAVALAGVGVVGLIAFFNGRDESTTGAPPARTATAEVSPLGDALLEAGNVVLLYGDEADAPALRRLAQDLGAPDTPELRAAGQAVVVRRDPEVDGVEAQAQTANLVVSNPRDPGLQAFVERWLGLGAQG